MKITRLYIYPIKSCAAVAVDELTFDEAGPVGDRRFMLVDPAGKFLSQRTLPKMAHIYPAYSHDSLLVSADDMEPLVVSLTRADGEESDAETLSVRVWNDEMQAQDCGDEAAAWFEGCLGRPCRLVRVSPETQRQVNLKYAAEGELVGFADGYPLLITCEESLAVLSQTVGRELDMLRFRPNVVTCGSAAFSELSWQTMTNDSGGELVITKPCERCVIPTRDIVSQQREADVMAALKEHCFIDSEIIFGQNAVARGVRKLTVGELLRSE